MFDQQISEARRVRSDFSCFSATPDGVTLDRKILDFLTYSQCTVEYAAELGRVTFRTFNPHAAQPPSVNKRTLELAQFLGGRLQQQYGVAAALIDYIKEGKECNEQFAACVGVMIWRMQHEGLHFDAACAEYAPQFSADFLSGLTEACGVGRIAEFLVGDRQSK